MMSSSTSDDQIVNVYRFKNDQPAHGGNREEFQIMTGHSDDDCGHDTRKYLREYTGLTGIHGLYYLTEKRSRCEKLFWAVIVLAAVAGCVYMIQEICVKFAQNPVIVSFATTETPIHQIPFPAVTICPESKTSMAVFNFSESFNKLTNDMPLTLDEKILPFVSLLCDLFDIDEEEYEWETYSDDFYRIIDKVKPDPDTLFDYFDDKNWKCKWLGDPYNCTDLLVPVMTDEGVCYSFNVADRSDIFKENVLQYKNYLQTNQSSEKWSADTGYAEDAPAEAYPRRALMSGADNALSITLTLMKNDVDLTCKRAMQGFKVLLHHPMDLPRLRKHYFRVPVNHAVVATVRPGLTSTSEKVQTFSAEKRQCYFQSEVKLKYFKAYTQTNCQLDCLTKYTLRECKCVGFFMPRTSNNTPICGVELAACIKRIETNIKVFELSRKFSPSVEFEDSCDCKPLCTTLSYDAETSQTEWRVYDLLLNLLESAATVEERREVKSQGGLYVSMLSIYFKDDQFLSAERNELYGISDLISNFGGLVGLFTGFSMISLIEAIYFFSLRIFCNERMYGRWSGPPN